MLVKNILFLSIGILVIATIIFMLQAALGYVQVKSTPPGWEIIRPPSEVSTLLIDNDTVWTGGKEGIVLISRTNRSRIPLPEDAPPTSYVRQIFRDRNGSIWIAHDGGLIWFTEGSWQVISPSPDVPFRRVVSLAQHRDGSIIAGTDGDAFVDTGSGWQSLRSLGMPPVALAEGIRVTRSGEIWVGCGEPMRGALLRFDGKVWHQYAVNDGLPHPSVRALAEGPDGAVWAATGYSRSGGAARFYGGVWTNLTSADGLAGESIRSIFFDDQGRVWIGSEYDGIAVRSNNTWTILTEKDGLAGYEVKTMVQDNDGVYWLGTNSGLSRIFKGSPGF